jgi:hypothetical protein
MEVLDLKSNLIERISKVDDPEFFEALNLFIDIKLEQKIYHISDAQKLIIEEGLAQFEKGEGIADDELDMKVKRWLSRK